MFGWDFEVDAWSRFWRWKIDQDLCLNLWYDPLGYFGELNWTLGSVVPLAMFLDMPQVSLVPNHVTLISNDNTASPDTALSFKQFYLKCAWL